MPRRIKDILKQVTKANAAAGANTDPIDLEQVNGGEIEGIALELTLPDQAGLSDAKILTFALQDSADGSAFAAVDPAVSTTQTGASGAGAAAKTITLPIPASARRYIRVAQTASATPGTLSGSFVAALVF